MCTIMSIAKKDRRIGEMIKKIKTIVEEMYKVPM